MVKYDYSLDVGQSIETDEKIKKKEEKEPQGCCIPKQDTNTGDVKEEQPENAPETPKEEEPGKNSQEQEVEEEQLENIPEEPEKKEPDKKEETIKITPVSFDKAKLISDFEEKKEEGPAEKEEPKTEEEDEKDVNEFLEESFTRESKERDVYNNNKNKIKEKPAPSRKNKYLTIAVILIAIAASLFGYLYFKEPAQAEVPVIPEPPNITEIITQSNTTDNKTLIPAEDTAITDNKTKEIPAENKTADDALQDFTNLLKDA